MTSRASRLGNASWRPVLVASLVLAAFAACSNVVAPSGPSLSITEQGAADTIRAILTTPLTVTVKGPGDQPAPAVVVHFEGLYYDSAPDIARGALVGRIGGSQIEDDAWDTTDASGHASVRVLLGPYVGTGRVLITIPQYRLTDTAAFLILAGNADHVSAQPRDTTMYAGNHLQLRSRVVDRFGNPRAEAVSYLGDSAAISVSAAGAVSAVAIGRAPVIASWHTPAGTLWADTSWISVVPQGTLAMGDARGVWTVNMDGSNLKLVIANPDNTGGLENVSWAPDASTILYDVLDRVYSTTLTGIARRVTGDNSLLAETMPTYSRSGTWIFFAARVAPQSQEIWRVHPDGTSAERFSPMAGSNEYDSHPSAAADGRVVYFSRRPCCPSQLLILNSAGGLADSVSVAAQNPRFSPGDSLLALGGGDVRVVHPDGTGLRTVSRPGRDYDWPLDWSPDGRWIVVKSSVYLDLINVTSGATLPLGWSLNFSYPAWKP